MIHQEFSPKEVAALAGVTTATVIRHIRRKKLRAKRTRRYAIAAEDVTAFLVATARRNANKEGVNP